MKAGSLIFILVCLIFPIYAEMQSIVLSELVNPDSIAVDHSRLFVTEGISIYIYDLSSFKLLHKFGKRGEGPKEFMINRQSGNPPLSIDVETKELIVNSLNKVSFFSKEGMYKRDVKVGASSDGFIPFLKGFAAETLATRDGKRYWVLHLYDQEMNKTKELTRIKHHFQGVGEGIKVLQESRIYRVGEGRLFVAWDKDFNIDVYNFPGTKIYSISYDYKKAAVTPQAKRDIIHYFKTDPKLKELYPFIKPVYIPDTYPALRNMFIDNGKIFAVTYKKKKAKSECLVFDLRGKPLETTYLHLIPADIFGLYPYSIRNGKVYQLIETNDEEWKLNISDI